MKKNQFAILLFILTFFTHIIVRSQTVSTPDGYAAYAGVTGGGNATPVVVFTPAEFRSAVSGNSPTVVIVNGKLDVGDVNVGSNKTIIGANAQSGLYGGTIKIQGSNYIIQNLIIGPHSDNDAMEVSGATNVFIHKCEFYDGGDGNLDIVRGSDYVTVSWCKFYYINQTNHKLSVLIGNGDNVTSDEGKLHVTMHHCWFADGCRSRMPRVRYGYVHIYNNYYSCEGNNYCIGTGFKSHIRVENSYFDGIRDPWDTDSEDNQAQMGWNGLKFDNCEQPSYIENNYPVFELPYEYQPDKVEVVKSIVTTGAGNVFGGVINDSLQVEITFPADSSMFMANNMFAIEAKAVSKNSTVDNVSFYCDSLLNTDSEPPYAINRENPETGKYYFWATATDANGSVAISNGITVFVGSKVLLNKPFNGETFRIPTDIILEAEAWDAEGAISKVEFFEGENLIGADQNAPYTFNWSNVNPGTYTLLTKATDNQGNTLQSDAVTVTVFGGPEGYEFCAEEYDECVTDKLVNIAFGAEEKFNYLYNVTGTVDCSVNEFGDPNPNVPKACYIQDAPTPFVEIRYPSSGKIYDAPAEIEIYALAIDNDGTIDSISFYQNDVFVGRVKNKPTLATRFSISDVYGGEYDFKAQVQDDDGNIAVSEVITITVNGGNAVFDHAANTITIYPNPVSDELIVNLGHCPASGHVSITDINGRILKKGELKGGQNKIIFTEYPAGNYFIYIDSSEGTIVKKIIKR
jgi:pectate lyase